MHEARSIGNALHATMHVSQVRFYTHREGLEILLICNNATHDVATQFYVCY